MKRIPLTAVLTMLALTQLYAVSGTGVAIVNANGTSSMRLYKVTNNHVDTNYAIISYWPTFGNNGFPVAINSHGTHLAVVRWSGNMTDNDCRISLLRLANPSKSVDIAYYGDDGGNAWGSKQICWPQGDWIYFTTANLSKYLYRVNTQTRTIEFVAFINLNKTNDPNGNFGAELKMSSINYRMQLTGGLYFTLQELQSAPGGALNTNGWPGGAFTIQGCGHSISPSGNFMGNQVDPGHCIRIVSTLDWGRRQVGGSSLYTAIDRNRMSVDKADPLLACTPATDPCTGSNTSFIETIGCGQTTMGNSFSANSDKWECLVSGWYPDGRELGNGGNFILFNPFDSMALNVTRIPRKQSSQLTGSCQIDANKSGFVAHPTFFVKEPVGDIIPELRADATSDYIVPGLDDNTQFPALTKMPKTPDGGWPIVPVAVGSHPAGATGKDLTVALGAAGAGILRLEFGDVKGRHVVKVFDPRGGLVTERIGDGATEEFNRRDGFRRGIYVFHIRANGCSTTRRVSIL